MLPLAFGSCAGWLHRPTSAPTSRGVVLCAAHGFEELGARHAWRLLADDPPLAAHALPLSLEARVVSYAAREIEPGAIIPLRPSGRNHPFTLVLTSPSWRATLAFDPLNRIVVTAPEPSSR